MDTFDALDELRAEVQKEAEELPRPMTIQEIVDPQEEEHFCRVAWVGKVGQDVSY